MQAVNDKVLCKEVNVGRTAGGVELPKGANVDQAKYEVVSVGKGRLNMDGTREPICVKVGDFILVAGKGSGFPYEGQDYVIFTEHMIGAIVTAEQHKIDELDTHKLSVIQP